MNYEDNKKEFISLIKGLCGSYSAYQIFSDFCELAAISLYQPFAKDEKLEEKYLTIIGKYKKDEIYIFPKLLAYVANGLTASFGDFLGECYMNLEIGNKHQGQFFTPYNISKFMSNIIDFKLNKEKKESFSEPACGSGGMIVARADAMKEAGMNYQKIMEVQAVDTDKICFHMCYIHCTLLHISAEIIWGNSLSCEIFEMWHTPANFLNGDYRWGLIFPEKEIREKEQSMIKNIPVSNKEFFQGTLF